MVAEVILIYVFSYIWLGVTFDTREISEQFKRTGLFIPGFRPGPRTQEYLDRVVSRVNYVGAGFLSLIAILPSLVSSFMQVRPEVAQFFGGTGLLIVVSVVLDLVLADLNLSSVHHLPQYLFQLLVNVYGHTNRVIWDQRMQLVVSLLSLQSKAVTLIDLVHNHHEESKLILLGRRILIS